MKKVLLRSIAVIFGIVMGCAAGGYMTFHRYARDYAMVRAFAWSGISAAVSEGQYDKNSSDAKQDLLYTLNYYTQGVQSSKIRPKIRWLGRPFRSEYPAGSQEATSPSVWHAFAKCSESNCFPTPKTLWITARQFLATTPVPEATPAARRLTIIGIRGKRL